MHKRKGIGLIEVLVAVSIFALLVSLMTFSAGTVRRKAKQLICRSNLRQYSLAARMYVDNNEGHYPDAEKWLFKEGATGNPNRWHDKQFDIGKNNSLGGALWPCLAAKNVHVCPTFKTIAKLKGCQYCNDSIIKIEPQYSYSMNAYLGVGNHKKIETEDMVKKTHKIFLFSEENTWVIDGLNKTPFNDNSLLATKNGQNNCFATFHEAKIGETNKGYAYAAFVDGRVDRVCAWDKQDASYQLAWPLEKEN
ncbi:MAG: type II secretion system protein [Planctomycetes bacterium]|nr:type II secretion system protein [Planctomycetota bacterium]